MCGPSLSTPNLTLGFIGFGRISQVVLRRLMAFSAPDSPPRVVYLSSRARPNQAELDAGFSKAFGLDVRRVEKDELAKTADVVIVLCDQNPQTVNLVNSEFLGRMKKTAILVNAARVSGASRLVSLARWPLYHPLAVLHRLTPRARSSTRTTSRLPSPRPRSSARGWTSSPANPISRPTTRSSKPRTAC